MYSDFFSYFSTSSAPLAAASFSFLAISSFVVSFIFLSSLILTDEGGSFFVSPSSPM